MSTRDVPGLKDKKGKSKNNDELAMGCWAEHEDGSMLFVESTEDGRVVYSVFDLTGPTVFEYRDTMRELGFKKAFSYHGVKDDDFQTPWTWHDKTPFPWDAVIAAGGQDGARHASAEHIMSAAEKVAKHRNMHRRPFERVEPIAKAGTVGRMILDKVKRAMSELGK